MKKRILLSLVCLSLLVFALSGVSYGWQGRMGGAGDPYGLLQDESDFLIHPAKLANGEGIKYYGHYGFTYTDIMDWDYELVWFDISSTFMFDTSGQEYNHNGLLGAATPLGPGRFGIFFTYDGMRGDYDGSLDILTWAPSYAAYDLQSDLDNFALRLLYGLPVGSFQLGGEVQFAYRQEQNENLEHANDLSVAWSNYTLGMAWPETNLLPFQFPYDSSYWEALFKGSLEGIVGPLDLEFTLRGGFIFAGDNDLEMARPISSPGSTDMDGDINGWQIGGDLWIRYAAGDGLAFPFLVRVDYTEKSRDGDGPGMLLWSANSYSYENEEQNLQIAVGGGVDKELGAGTRVAGGIYYNYLQGVKSISLHETRIGAWTDWDNSDYPDCTEQQILVRLAGEHEFSPVVALRMGLSFFYGWVGENFVFTQSNNTPPGGNYTNDIDLNGYHWGIGGTLGGSVKFQQFTMEPFFNVGYQELNLNGGGGSVPIDGSYFDPWAMDLSRSEWYIGGGCSFLYDLP